MLRLQGVQIVDSDVYCRRQRLLLEREVVDRVAGMEGVVRLY